EKFSFNEFKTFVCEGSFDVVGFRCYCRDHNYVSHHARIVKALNPNTLTLVGGPHPSALPEFVLSNMLNIDFAWKAEAEEGLPSLLRLFTAYRQNIPEQHLKTIPGLVWRSKLEKRIMTNQPGFGI